MSRRLCFVLLLAWAAGTGASAATFTTRHARPGGNTLLAIATAEGRIVAVGTSGTVLVSSDRTTWTRGHSGTAAALRGVCFGRGKFIAVGDGGTILTSPDGVAWRPANATGTASQLNTVCFAQDFFVAAGVDGTIVSSPDGEFWQLRASGTTAELRSATFSPSLRRVVVAGQGGTARRSSDGLTWQGSPTLTSQDIVAVLWASGREEFHYLTAPGTETINSEEIRLRANGEWYPAGRSIGEGVKTTRPIQGATLAGDRIYAFGPEGFIHGEKVISPGPGSRWDVEPTDTVHGLCTGTWDGQSLWVVGEGETILQSTPLRRGALVNLSTRGWVRGASQTLIAGFVRGPGEPREILVRAAGPSLVPLGVTEALAATQVELIGQGGLRLAMNAGWDRDAGAAASVRNAIGRAGAFAFPAGSGDAAVLPTLQPGAYTAHVTGVNGANGVALVEIYQTDAAGEDDPPLINLATRGTVSGNGEPLIAGVTIGGDGPRRLLVRAVGPTLAQFGIADALSLPTLELRTATSIRAPGSAWSGFQADELRAAANRAGAFPLAEGSADYAWVIDLFPGNWTFFVQGRSGSSGVALVEVYDLTH